MESFQKQKSTNDILNKGLVIFLLFINMACIKEVGTELVEEPISKSGNFSLGKMLDLPQTLVESDTHRYEKILQHLVHNRPSKVWPVNSPFPLKGSIVPYNRVVAFYGNLYSSGMGVLGALPDDEMLEKLLKEVEAWEKADPMLPVIPALHYITVTAQRNPGPGRKYRLRMPFNQIEEIIRMAAKIDALIILDIQPGHSTLKEEIPQLNKYLSMPNVHLGIDPEYSMKGGETPSKKIGTLDAADINYAATYLADLVHDFNLPPKMLIVHRFTREMITNYSKIETRSEVQIIINMDGFGFAAKKINTYKYCVAAEPVQFTGFKLFYHQDTQDKRWPALMMPEEILNLYPKPIYIQYQ
ncbi:MAG: hypothetical protein ABIQ11_00570 [Saprospiraceae bacterium]